MTEWFPIIISRFIQDNNQERPLMKRVPLLLAALLCLSSCSCHWNGRTITVTPFGGRQHERNMTEVRALSREALPDSLISFFPVLSENGIRDVLLLEENLFPGSQKISLKNLNTLPWIYSESYLAADKEEYLRIFDEALQHFDSDSYDSYEFYSYNQLWNQIMGIEPYPSEVSCIYVPDGASENDTTSTVVLRKGEGMILEDLRLYDKIPEPIKHGYSSGMTFSDSERSSIKYWIIIW